MAAVSFNQWKINRSDSKITSAVKSKLASQTQEVSFLCHERKLLTSPLLNQAEKRAPCFLFFFLFAARVVAAIAYDECGKINGAICLVAAAAATALSK